MSSIPQAYLDTLNPLIATARKFMEDGQTLHPVAFVGNFTTGMTVPVLFDTSSIEAKEDSSMGIRLAARELDADFVAVIMEAWSLPEDKARNYQAIVDRYGSIAASPLPDRYRHHFCRDLPRSLARADAHQTDRNVEKSTYLRRTQLPLVFRGRRKVCWPAASQR